MSDAGALILLPLKPMRIKSDLKMNKYTAVTSCDSQNDKLFKGKLARISIY